MKIYVSEAITALVRKAKEAATADEALKYSQAACNVANTWATALTCEQLKGQLSDNETRASA